MMAAVICERFGWTWEEYQNQPVEFLRCIIARLEAEALESRANEVKRGVSRVVG